MVRRRSRSLQLSPRLWLLFAVGFIFVVSGAVWGLSLASRTAHAQAAKITRIQRWEGALQGCLSNTTPEEKQKWPHWIHGCACLATALVERCVPTDDIEAKQVLQCMSGQAARANTIMDYCSRTLNLTLVKKL